MNFRKFLILLQRNSWQLKISFAEEAKAKAQAIVNQHKRDVDVIKRWNAPKVKLNVEKIAKASKGEINEKSIGEYMKVLRKTSTGIGKVLLEENIKIKAELKEQKRLLNKNYLKDKLNSKKSEQRHPVRQKIKKMRSQRIFPQPKSYTNYRKRNGIFNKNSIKTWKSNRLHLFVSPRGK